MIDVVAETASLRRSGMGSVTGQVFLRGPTGDFPESGWSDFPVVILGWWIEGLIDLLAGREESFQGMFMDGPFAFIVKRGTGNSGRIEWGKRGTTTAVGIVDIVALLRSAVAAGRLVAEGCRARGWESRDLATLEAAIARSAV
jgi:hypothetical protein